MTDVTSPRALRDSARSANNNKTKNVEVKARVVILGGGIAGASVAKALSSHAKDGLEVVLVEKQTEFILKPAIMRCVETNIQQFKTEAIKIMRTYPAFLPNCRVVHDSIIKVSKQKIILSKETLAYDFLVICTGTRFSVDPNLQNVLNKDFYDYSISEVSDSSLDTKNASHVLVAGSAWPGMQVASHIACHYPDKKISLVVREKELRKENKTNKLLNKWFNNHNVTVFMGDRIKSAAAKSENNDTIIYKLKSGETIEADKLFWLGNKVGNTEFLDDECSKALNKHGQIKVSSNMQVKGCKNIFACGDVVSESPSQADVALKEAKQVVRNIRLLLKGKEAKYRKKTKATCLLIPLGTDIMLTYCGKYIKVAQQACPKMLKNYFDQLLTTVTETSKNWCSMGKITPPSQTPIARTSSRGQLSIGRSGSISSRSSSSSSLFDLPVTLVLWCHTHTCKYLCGYLLSRGHNLRVVVPPLSGAIEELSGFEYAITTMPTTQFEQKKLFKGVDKIIVSTDNGPVMDELLPRKAELIEKYKTDQLEHIVFLSNGGEFDDEFDLNYYLCDIYIKYKKLLESIGIPLTCISTHGTHITRARFFAQTFSQLKTFVYPAVPVKTQSVDESDLSEIIERILDEGKPHYDKVYSLVNREEIDPKYLLASIGEALGEEVLAQEIPIDLYIETLQAMPGMSTEWIEAVRVILTDERSYVSSSDVKDLLGREPRNFHDWAQENAHLFL